MLGFFQYTAVVLFIWVGIVMIGHICSGNGVNLWSIPGFAFIGSTIFLIIKGLPPLGIFGGC